MYSLLTLVISCVSECFRLYMFSTCACLECVHARSVHRPEPGTRFPRTGIVAVLSCYVDGCRESNPGPLQAQQVLLRTELFLQPLRGLSDTCPSWPRTCSNPPVSASLGFQACSITPSSPAFVLHTGVGECVHTHSVEAHC